MSARTIFLSASLLALACTAEKLTEPRTVSSATFQEPAPIPDEEPRPPALRGVIADADFALSDRRRNTRPGVWPWGESPRFVIPDDEEAGWEMSEAERASRRAFEGAPPVMPHSEDFSGGRQTCLDCHARGMSIGDRRARAMSHHPMPNCVQCHVEAETSVFAAFDPGPPANAFSGLTAAGRGKRAYEGAPPTVPHGTELRQTCLSCHGEYGWEGIRIDHAGRASCVQCHISGDAPPPALAAR